VGLLCWGTYLKRVREEQSSWHLSKLTGKVAQGGFAKEKIGLSGTEQAIHRETVLQSHQNIPPAARAASSDSSVILVSESSMRKEFRHKD